MTYNAADPTTDGGRMTKPSIITNADLDVIERNMSTSPANALGLVAEVRRLRAAEQRVRALCEFQFKNDAPGGSLYSGGAYDVAADVLAILDGGP